MSKLKEATTQERAIEYLERHYAKHSDSIYSQKEVRTRKGKRADGLLCFLKDEKPYTISFEAKSHKTLGALVSSFDDNKLGIHSLIIASLLTSILTIGLIFLSPLAWHFTTAIALVSFVVLFFAYAITADILDLNNYRAIDVINQLKQYPANEQWIAYSRHTDNLLFNTPSSKNKNNVDVLRKLCRKNGFGLLLVSRNGCREELSPKTKKGMFLQHYSKEQEILKLISNREGMLQI